MRNCRAPFAATSKMANFGPSSAKTGFLASPFGTSFQWFESNLLDTKERFSKMEERHQKNTKYLMTVGKKSFGQFFESPMFEPNVAISGSESPKIQFLPQVLVFFTPMKNAIVKPTQSSKTEKNLKPQIRF